MYNWAWAYDYTGQVGRGPFGSIAETKFHFEIQTPSSCKGLTVTSTDPYVWPSGTGGATSTTVIAQLSEPASNDGCVVKFQNPTPIAKSGGHLHDGNRPAGSLSPASCTILSGTTSCSVQYDSSEISGDEQIQATLADSGEISQVTITIRVPNLIQLPTTNSNYFELWGALGQKSPCSGQVVDSDHNDNHFGTLQTILIVPLLAEDYFLTSNGSSIGINDISLPSGGLFDIKNNWNTPHKSHRIGKSVDINLCSRDTNSNTYIPVDKKLLTNLAGKLGGRPAKEATIHYDFP